MKKLIVLFFLLILTFSYSQIRKEIEIKRFQTPPLIDGIIDEDQWKNLKPRYLQKH